MKKSFAKQFRRASVRERLLVTLLCAGAGACGEPSSYVGGYCGKGAAERIIDDMENGDWRFSSPGIEGWWQCAWDFNALGAKAPKGCQGTNNQALMAEPTEGEVTAPEKVPPRPGSHYARHAVEGPSTGWGIAIFLDFDNHKGFDASPWTGVRFHARSNTFGGDLVRMHIPDWNTSPQGACRVANGVGCDRNFGAEVLLGEEWNEYSFYWADLSQPDPSVIAGADFPALDTSRIIGIRFQIDGKGEPTLRSVPAFDFWIDDVSFLCDAKSAH